MFSALKKKKALPLVAGELSHVVSLLLPPPPHLIVHANLRPASAGTKTLPEIFPCNCMENSAPLLYLNIAPRRDLSEECYGCLQTGDFS